MGLDARTRKEINDAVFGRTDYEPIVTFYDHASYNEVLSKESGRPRFTEKTYTLIKPTHPDLKVRDQVSHPTTDEEKDQYPRQWARYQKTKTEQREFKPPLQAIPGMQISTFRELQELKIFDAQALADYEGDLGEIDYMRDMAKRIMEVAREARKLREKREAVREDNRGQHDYSSPIPGRITPTSGQSLKAEVTQEKGHKKEGGQEESHQEVIGTFQFPTALNWAN